LAKQENSVIPPTDSVLPLLSRNETNQGQERPFNAGSKHFLPGQPTPFVLTDSYCVTQTAPNYATAYVWSWPDYSPRHPDHFVYRNQSSNFSQTVTLSIENASLEKVLKELEKQVPQRFVYTQSMMAQSRPITVRFSKLPLDSALQRCFDNQPLAYTKDQHFIVLRSAVVSPDTRTPPLILTGKVTDENTQPAQGITLKSKLSGQSTSSDKSGEFSLPVESSGDILYVSGAEIQPQEIPLQGQRYIAISVAHRIGSLDETVVIGYGKTTRRMNTGSVGKINQATIAQQPVGNALTALQGRIAGLEVTQSNGLPGSSVKVQIRGRNSIAQGSQPLFIIDGVPLAAGNGILNQLASAVGDPSNAPELANGISPLINLNPADIESIEVLKDADATAIYGSRGAGGVILITTRKGQGGKLQTNFSVKSGWSRITRSMDFLTTPQYLAMRREAFAQDNIIPDETNAPRPPVVGYYPLY
jgi:TonB-dependent SusC/RagA subfamily outer membrane receptor